MKNSENFMDAVLLIPSPQEKPKARFCTETEAEKHQSRERPGSYQENKPEHSPDLQQWVG